MNKTTLATCLLIVTALLVSAGWATKAVNAPPQDMISTPDTSLAVELSLDDMVKQSDAIVIGNCTETKSVWIDRSLVTLATVSVTESLKGEASTLTVALPGGVDVNRKVPVAMTYPGAPQIRPGEDVFLFLSAESDVAGSYTVAGFSQGKFSIVTDEDGQKMVSRDLKKTVLQGENGVRRGQSSATPLANFKAEVKGLLNKQ